MATELTWTGDVNRAVASAATAAEQSKWQAWYLLASLCGNSNLAFSASAGKWSVIRTCGATDGTSGTLTADTTDRLHLSSGVYTSNDWVFGANTTSGTARSWALIQSPAALGSIYMVVDFGNATGGKFDVYFGKTISTTGTTTARPTFSDEWGYAAAQVSNNSVANVHRCNVMLSTRGDFWFYETYDGFGTMYSVLGLTKPAGASSSDPYATVSVFVGAGGVNSTGGMQAALNSATSVIGNANAIGKCRNYNGAAAGVVAFVGPAISITNAAANVVTSSNMTGANQSDGTFNMLAVSAYDFTNGEVKGRLYDVYWASGGLAQASTEPGTAPFECLKVGHCWLPWSSSTAPMI